MCTTHYSYAPLLCLPRLPAVWWYIYICTYPPPDPLMQCIFGLHITRQIETWSIHKCGVVPTLYLRALCARAIGTEGGDFGRSIYPISIGGGGRGSRFCRKNYFPQIFRPSYGPACMHKSYIYVGGFIAENSSQISKGVLALFSFNPIYSGHYFRPICWVWVKKQDQSYFTLKARFEKCISSKNWR